MPDHDRSGTATRIAVIGGGANDEHEVSLASAAAVTRAIQSLGFEAVPLTVGHTGGWRHTEGVGLSPPTRSPCCPRAVRPSRRSTACTARTARSPGSSR
ncbi:hypothetical protein P9139_14645 [Curtobacterium flaccumfaciens]|nr:hypothetical protein P9139_14645 [Curtobacterium flaccumfaciens]